MTEPPPSVQGPRVFVSYSHHDREVLEVLLKLLVAEGVEVRLDTLQMMPGEDLVPRIAEEVSESDCVLAVISRQSVRSRWVTAELSQALQLEIATGGPRVIPVRLDDCEVPPFLARKIVADFSSPAVMATSLKTLMAAVRSDKPASEFTRQDEFEMLMERTTIRGDDVRPAAVLCASVLTTVKNVLLTAYRLNGRIPYGHVPSLRVLLFTVHEEFHCLRLQLWVSDPTAVIHCRHRFTTDPHRQPFLNPAAFAWRTQSLHAVNYSTEYEKDPQAYLDEAVQHGFTREKVANIIVHVASSVSIPLSRVTFSPTVGSPPAVICIDSERANVFPPAVHGVIEELVQDIVNDHNTGRRAMFDFEDRDFTQDNRGIIDECSD